jgi:hypothetical protein
LGDLEFEDSFPIDLRRHAIAKGFVGGEFLKTFVCLQNL